MITQNITGNLTTPNPTTARTKQVDGTIVPFEEEIARSFEPTASSNLDDPKDKKDKGDDENESIENANNGSMDDEDVTDGVAKKGFDEDDNGRVGE